MEPEQVIELPDGAIFLDGTLTYNLEDVPDEGVKERPLVSFLVNTDKRMAQYFITCVREGDRLPEGIRSVRDRHLFIGAYPDGDKGGLVYFFESEGRLRRRHRI